MTTTPDPYGQQQYVPHPVYAAQPVKDLTAFAGLSFALAILYTATTVINAVVVGPALETDAAGDLDAWLAVYGLNALFGIPVLIACWVFASLWLQRARRNAEVIEPGYPHRRSEVWTWLGWVIPVVSFWFPYQLVRDVHDASTHRTSTTPVIGWWWAFFIVSILSLRASNSVENSGSASATSVAVFTALVTVGALVTWGMVLRTVTRDQRAPLS